MTSETVQNTIGSLDGEGAADHDLPFKFGVRPRVATPFPFSTRQFARLLVLRAKVGAGMLAADDICAA
jgi:hypothetical protein